MFYANVVPPYVFVSPKEPIDDYYASLSTNFTDRQVTWQHMFRFGITTIEVVPGVEVEVYTDPYGFLLDWLTYDPINGGVNDTRCRQSEYTPI